MSIQIFPVSGLPIIKKGDDLAALIADNMRSRNIPLQSGDIVVVCHVIVSRAEGRVINLNSIMPSEPANNFALFTGKDPRLVEVILRESRAIRRMSKGVIISETRQGFVCANAGVDKSNVPGDDAIAPLPFDSDLSAEILRLRLNDIASVKVAVVITDTFGRAHRDGEVNVAIGSSGLEVIRDRRGERDLFNYTLSVKRTAVADELASAAELVIGQANEGIPAAVIRGYHYKPSNISKAADLVRGRDKDLFL